MYTTNANLDIAYGKKINSDLIFVIINLYSSPAAVLSSDLTVKNSDFFDIRDVWDVNQSSFAFQDNNYDEENKYGMIFFHDMDNYIVKKCS